MHIITNVVSSNPVHSNLYSIQHYVIKFVRDLEQVGGFLRVLLFPPPIEMDKGSPPSGIGSFGDFGYPV